MVVARQTVTLDRLSGGRLTLGIGSGAFPFEFEYCGEQADARVRGQMLDEHLALLDQLWSGRPVRHEGASTGQQDPSGPPSATRHRCSGPASPVWVGGTWPGVRPFERAARWDGVAPMRTDGGWDVADTAAVAARMRDLRPPGAPFDVAVPGESDGSDPARRARYDQHSEAGATWWIEAIHPWRQDLPRELPWPAAARQRIDAGP